MKGKKRDLRSDPNCDKKRCQVVSIEPLSEQPRGRLRTQPRRRPERNRGLSRDEEYNPVGRNDRRKRNDG